MKWLFLVHQVQTTNSRERVKIWRLTRQVGALLYRNSVYVLPLKKERLEDFQWLCQEIRDSQGEASVFTSESHDEKENRALVALFRQVREAEYDALRASAEKLLKRIRRTGQQLSSALLRALAKEAKRLHDTFGQIERVDFFSAPGKKRTQASLAEIVDRISQLEPRREQARPVRRYSRSAFRGKVWATREHIHIDRLCSAWLIKRFIDPEARFVFAPENKLPKDAIPFDTFGGEFSHHGEDCSIETFLKSFRLRDKALAQIAEIVHDIDVKDAKFARPEAAGIDVIVRTLSDYLGNDEKALSTGFILLDALYDRFSAGGGER